MRSSTGFTLAGTGCDEVGVAVPVPSERLGAWMDLGRFRPVGGDAGTATLMVLVAACDALAVDGAAAVPSVFSDVGVLIEAPDGGEGMHVYQLWQTGDHPGLRARMAALGMPGALVRGGTLRVDALEAAGVMPWRASPYEVETTSPVPAVDQGDSSIMWWHLGRHGLIQVRYGIEGLSMRPGAGSVTVEEGTPIHDLLGEEQAAGAGIIFGFRAITGQVDLIPPT